MARIENFTCIVEGVIITGTHLEDLEGYPLWLRRHLHKRQPGMTGDFIVLENAKIHGPQGTHEAGYFIIDGRRVNAQSIHPVSDEDQP